MSNVMQVDLFDKIILIVVRGWNVVVLYWHGAIESKQTLNQEKGKQFHWIRLIWSRNNPKDNDSAVVAKTRKSLLIPTLR